MHFANVVAEWYLGAHFTFGGGKDKPHPGASGQSAQEIAAQVQARRAVTASVVEDALRAVVHAKQYCEHNELVQGSARSFLAKAGQTLEGVLREALAECKLREAEREVKAAAAKATAQDKDRQPAAGGAAASGREF